MFSRFKKQGRQPFDPTGKTPVIRSSICTGEKVAGYRDAATGRFTEVMLIRSEADREEFLKTYGFRPEDLRYEW